MRYLTTENLLGTNSLHPHFSEASMAEVLLKVLLKMLLELLS